MVRELPTRYEGRFAEPIVGHNQELEKLWQLSWYESVTLQLDSLLKLANLSFRLTPHVLTIAKGAYMKDWKTTVSGVVKAVFSVLTIFGISTGHLTEALVTAFLAAGVEIVQSIFTADKN